MTFWIHQRFIDTASTMVMQQRSGYLGMMQQQRSGYTAVPDVDDTAVNGGEGTTSSGGDDSILKPSPPSTFRKVFLGVGLFITGGFFLLGAGRVASNLWERIARSRGSGSVSSSHHEMIPTLFSIVDDDNQFLYSLDNPLYDELQSSVFHSSSTTIGNDNWSKSAVESYPELFVSLESESCTTDDDTARTMGDSRSSSTTSQASMVLTWTLGKDKLGHDLLHDDDIIVLRCGLSQDESESSGKALIVEAATIAQARSTHRFHNRDHGSSDSDSSSMSGRDSSANTWIVPIVPSFVLRQDSCQFFLYKKLRSMEYAEVATVAVPLLDNSHTPFGIHIALTSTPDRMLVQFTTGASGVPVVRYSKHSKQHHRRTSSGQWKSSIEDDDHGSSDRSLSREAKGESDTYSAPDMCQAPANETAPGKFHSPGYLHKVFLTGLEPDTAYEYKVGLQTHRGEVIWSNDRSLSFTTALAAGDDTEHSFIVYGDQGCPKGGGWVEGRSWMDSMAKRERGSMRSIHHVGDLSYAQGAAHHWDAWFDMIEAVVAQTPLMVAVGNHEYDHESGGSGHKDPSHVETDSGFMPAWGTFGNDSGGECGVPTAKRFTMPDNGNGVFWYSFDYGLVHTVVISSEHDLSYGSPQHRWLENNLHETDRIVTPWIIVEVHRPLYEGELFWKDNTVGGAMRLEVEDLLFDYHVDVVFAGHHHAYHRTCDGLYRSICDQGGPTHLTVGTAGAHLSEDDMSDFTNDWTAHAILQTYGYGRVTVKNETTLHFEFVKHGNETDPTAGAVLDDVWIFRDR